MATPLMSLPDQSRGKRKYVVPWKSRKEFLKVYHDIYDDDEDLHLQAIRRIKTWRSRAGSKLSVAVENTGRLFESILNHKVALREHLVHEKEEMLRSSYGIAIIRFVNFVTEKGQTKAVAQPVHILARQFGIPEWIVRIRHDATHNMFPSLDMLSTAACWAVQYLKEEFWQCQSHDYNTSESKKLRKKNNKPIGEIRQALQNFKKQRFGQMKSVGVEQKTTTSEVKELKQCVKENRFCFMSCFLENGVLIPMAHELGKFGLKEEDIMSQPCPHLPPQFSEFWHPVLDMLKYTEAIGTLTKVALFSITDEDCLRNHLIAGWLDFILQGATENLDNEHTNGILFDKSSLPMKALLYACLDNTNKFNFHLIKYLLDKQELGDDVYTKLSDLVKVSSPSVNVNRQDSEGEEEGQGSVYSVQDVQVASFSHVTDSDQSHVLDDVQSSTSGDDIGWRICTDVVDWSTVPLGVIPSLGDEEADQENYCEGADENDDDDDDDGGGGGADGDPDNENDSDDVEDDDDEVHVRDWKRSRKKRSFEDEDDSATARRTSPKRSTYTVNDNELL